MPKNWCFQIAVVEKTLESPLDCKKIKPVNSKGNQPWTFIGRIYAEASILWPPHVKSQLTGKDPNAGKDWGQEAKREAEREMVGQDHWFNGHEFEQTPGMLQSMGLQRIRHDLATKQGLPWWLRQSSVCLQCRRPGFNPWVGKISWRRKWQSTPVFLPGKSHGRKSLLGYNPWGRDESNTTEWLHPLTSD